MRVVLDTNCLIMAISSRNRYNIIWKSFLVGDYILCITNEILEEYVEVIGRRIFHRPLQIWLLLLSSLGKMC